MPVPGRRYTLSYRPPTLDRVPVPVVTDVARVSPVDVANARIRAHAAGRSSWTPEALAELARLRRAWFEACEQEAIRRHLAVAA